MSETHISEVEEEADEEDPLDHMYPPDFSSESEHEAEATDPKLQRDFDQSLLCRDESELEDKIVASEGACPVEDDKLSPLIQSADLGTEPQEKQQPLDFLHDTSINGLGDSPPKNVSEFEGLFLPPKEEKLTGVQRGECSVFDPKTEMPVGEQKTCGEGIAFDSLLADFSSFLEQPASNAPPEPHNSDCQEPRVALEATGEDASEDGSKDEIDLDLLKGLVLDFLDAEPSETPPEAKENTTTQQEIPDFATLLQPPNETPPEVVPQKPVTSELAGQKYISFPGSKYAAPDLLAKPASLGTSKAGRPSLGVNRQKGNLLQLNLQPHSAIKRPAATQSESEIPAAKKKPSGGRVGPLDVTYSSQRTKKRKSYSDGCIEAFESGGGRVTLVLRSWAGGEEVEKSCFATHSLAAKLDRLFLTNTDDFWSDIESLFAVHVIAADQDVFQQIYDLCR